MEGNTTKLTKDEAKEVSTIATAAGSGDGDGAGGGESAAGGWGGWGGFSSWSYISDLQKAAEEISRNAAAVAKGIAADIQSTVEDSESYKEEDNLESPSNEEEEDELDRLRKSALDKLEKAGEDSLLSQGLKVIDTSVENFASGAWQALGSALKGGSNFIQKLEQNLAKSIQHGGAAGTVAPSLLEAGKAFTTKGIQVLENVGKETMELLISETGIDVENHSKFTDNQVDDPSFEEMTFDRCFYIYGGPEQLEELQALSNHYALIFNRRKTKLVADERSLYESKLKEVQQVLDLLSDLDASTREPNKGKQIEIKAEEIDSELKSLLDSSVNKAADMAAGFTSSLAGLAANDMIQRTAHRLESLHSEGVHRLSEICCFAVSQVLMLGKSIISNANKPQEEDSTGDLENIDWPVDSREKARIVRTKAQSMAGSIEAVSSSFIAGIGDVAEAYMEATREASVESHEAPSRKPIQEKAESLSERLRADGKHAVVKIQDALQYLAFVVVSTSNSVS